MIRPDTKHTFHLYVVRVKYRLALQQYLAEKGIETAIHYPTPLPFLPAYQYLAADKAEFPVSLQYQNEILSLPLYPELTKEQIDFIVSTIQEFYTLFTNQKEKETFLQNDVSG